MIKITQKISDLWFKLMIFLLDVGLYWVDWRFFRWKRVTQVTDSTIKLRETHHLLYRSVVHKSFMDYFLCDKSKLKVSLQRTTAAKFEYFLCESLFPHKKKLPTLWRHFNVERRDWLNKNFGKNQWRMLYTNTFDFELRFRTQADMMAYKMVWYD